MDNIEKFKDVNEVLAYLAEKFPKCFTLKGDAKPLKIGIFQELAERTDDEPKVSRTQLRQALRKYTNSWRYLHSVKAGVVRVDLDGNEGEKVEEQHAEHAQKTLQESKARFEQRKKEAQPPKKENKSYKNKSNEKKTGPKKATKFKNKNENSKRTDNKSRSTNKIELTQLDAALIKVGANVKIKLGKAPMDGTIVEIAKEEIHVQLQTGMVIKTVAESLYKA